MKFANASNLHRKSGVAQWRDLLFCFQFSRRLFSPDNHHQNQSAFIGPTRLGVFPQPVQSGEAGFQTRESALFCPDWATSPQRALALVRTPKTPAGPGRLLRQASSFQAFISQAMIGPLVTASAGKKRAIQHTAVTLPIIRKCAAEV